MGKGEESEGAWNHTNWGTERKGGSGFYWQRIKRDVGPRPLGLPERACQNSSEERGGRNGRIVLRPAHSERQP